MKIGLETQRLVSFTKRVDSIEAWCSECGKQREMIHPEEAAARTGVSLRAIYRLVEAHKLHFIETPEGLAYLSQLSYSGPGLPLKEFNVTPVMIVVIGPQPASANQGAAGGA
jgi:excisionase family DNA binding protein